MILTNISKATRRFEVLQTTALAQTAMMTLQPGQASAGRPEGHPHSDQVLLILEGEAIAEIAGETTSMSKGDVIIVPAGIRHRFSNPGKVPAVTFSVYSPPAYPGGAAE